MTTQGELLLELLSEEIPAGIQRRAIAELAGPAGSRGVAGACNVGDLRAAVAQIDALSGLIPALGSAADIGRLSVRGRGSPPSARPGPGRTDHSRSPFPVTRRDLCDERG